jgi:ATP-dependent exoDNAse (exonuclease V) beta subunit
VKAANRGTAVHNILDKYLSNDPDYIKKAMPSNIAMFRSGQTIIDQNIKEVFGIELPLYSGQLKTAGKTDLVCNWDGINSVLDYKTSKKPKTEDQILNYFLQATAYSLMVNELYELNITQFVVLIFVDHEKPQLFVKKVSDYETKTRNIFV